MSLKKYNKKRDFSNTPEPYGKKHSQIKHMYLIQKHAASHLHYDFRIEIDGVLKSWAVPKGPSLDPKVKRLAMHVEDHPIEYGSFEGIIPKGQYGGGTVMLWDQGTWEPEEIDAEKAYKTGNLTFKLYGKKLKGLWKLVRLKKTPNAWLLIKITDEYAQPEKKYDITKTETLSSASGRSMDEIAEAYDHEWNSAKKIPHVKKTKRTIKKKTQDLEKKLSVLLAKKTRMPANISPQLATLVDAAPLGNNWLHEIKIDGYRLICFLDNKKVRLMTRGNQDWTNKFPHLVSALKELNIENAIFDGEITALNAKKHADFQLLQNSIHDHTDENIFYYLFDIIYCNGRDLSDNTLIDRKEILQTILAANKNPFLRYSDHVLGNGRDVFKNACSLELEGIVSKKIDSEYAGKRTKTWLKVKCIKRQEFVVGGFTTPKGERKYFGSLLVGVYSHDNKLTYCGHVGTGFTQTSLKHISVLLQKNKSNQNPFTINPPGIKNISWVKPVIVIEVEFSEWTTDGILRHASFQGIRKDKKPKEITMETPQTIKKISNDNFHLTNSDRILYPKQGTTKLELAQYYDNIHEWILPYLANRPLTLVRCPSGKHADCFYQKHLPDQIKGIYSVPITEKNKTELYPYIKDKRGLIALVQLGVLEIHTWECHVSNVEKPDVIIFDLDPASDVTWKEVIQTAFLLKDELEKLNLESFVKTTGGKGLHVVLPIKRLYSWEQVKIFTQLFVNHIVSLNPKKYIATMSKAKRSGKIFIDYFRNNRGATAIAPYSTRVKDHAFVATPLSWDELSPRIKSDSFTIQNLPERLAKLKKDPWEDFFIIKQGLTFKNK